MRPIVSLPSTTDTRNERILGMNPFGQMMIFKGFFIRLFQVSVVLDCFVLHPIGKRYLTNIHLVIRN